MSWVLGVGGWGLLVVGCGLLVVGCLLLFVGCELVVACWESGAVLSLIYSPIFC